MWRLKLKRLRIKISISCTADEERDYDYDYYYDYDYGYDYYANYDIPKLACGKIDTVFIGEVILIPMLYHS